ncbi:MAG: hypothetical protein HC883_03665, partial [Bdellovibrionaceae bacterium]|nr:hypothetical protein [Pseudobdellovibrionaceae bacterium]
MNASLKVVEVDEIPYLLRIRRNDSLGLSSKSPDRKYQQDLYWLGQLGFAHGKQESGKSFCKAIQASPQEFTNRLLRARSEVSAEFSREFESKILKTEPLNLFGGLRYRLKTDKQGAGDRRIQSKLRAQLGAEVRFKNDLSSTLAISTGDSPVSRNADLGDGFLSKDIGLYMAFLSWKSSSHLTWHLGKMRNPYRQLGESELIWDSDITPEGLALQYKRPVGRFRPFATLGYFVLSENYTGNKLEDETDNVIVAAQVGAEFSWRSWSLIVAGGPVRYTNLQGVAFKDLTDEETGGNSSTADGRFLHNYHLSEGMLELIYTSSVKTGIFAHLVHNSAVSEDNRAYRMGLSLERGSWEP